MADEITCSIALPVLKAVACDGMALPDFETTFAVSVPLGAWLDVEYKGRKMRICGRASISRNGYIYFPDGDSFLSLELWGTYFDTHFPLYPNGRLVTAEC